MTVLCRDQATFVDLMGRVHYSEWPLLSTAILDVHDHIVPARPGQRLAHNLSSWQQRAIHDSNDTITFSTHKDVRQSQSQLLINILHDGRNVFLY
ncbi:hypothetical protein FPOAC2_05299 [Fusarium poae]|uniref:hypothetical protein n=1 Tax=Fusarium poae TaxID=36050 RepID=UPI001CE997EC|nr:hypothetical protein FPOAC1_005195 [Fusarium poae]KAG8671937.1 hypothetical protein FPOAC1_005195 [Fusarium poae]